MSKRAHQKVVHVESQRPPARKRRRQISAKEVEEGLAKDLRKVLARGKRKGTEFGDDLLAYLKRLDRRHPEWTPVLNQIRRRSQRLLPSHADDD